MFHKKYEMGSGSSRPVAEVGCLGTPNNHCEITLREKEGGGSGWTHRVCGANVHSDKRLKSATEIHINKKGCSARLYSLTERDGDVLDVEATTDAQTFKLGSATLDFAKRTQSYSTDYSDPLAYDPFSLSAVGGEEKGGSWMLLAVAGVIILVLILKKARGKTKTELQKGREEVSRMADNHLARN